MMLHTLRQTHGAKYDRPVFSNDLYENTLKH